MFWSDSLFYNSDSYPKYLDSMVGQKLNFAYGRNFHYKWWNVTVPDVSKCLAVIKLPIKIKISTKIYSCFSLKLKYIGSDQIHFRPDLNPCKVLHDPKRCKFGKKNRSVYSRFLSQLTNLQWIYSIACYKRTVCPRSLAPIYIVWDSVMWL